MRRFLLILVAILAMVSCKKSAIPPIPDNSRVRISVYSSQHSSVGTRAVSIDGFNSASQMGIYATLAPSTDLSGARDVNVGYGNPNGSQYWDANIAEQAIMHAGLGNALNLFAYHPYTGQYKSTVVLDPLLASPILTYTLPLDQSLDSTLVRADLMWGKTVNVKQEDGIAKLEFFHKLTKVTFNLFKGMDWGAEQANISELKMSGLALYKSARLDVSTGVLSAVANSGDDVPALVSTLATPLSLSSFEARKCEFLAIPVADVDGLLVEFVVNGAPYKFVINTVTVPSATNRSFDAGHNRVYNVTINKFSPEQIYITTTMVPWNVVSEIYFEGI